MATVRKPDLGFDQLRAYLARLYPGQRVIAIEPLAPDSGATTSSTTKVAGYGRPVRVVLAGDRGATRELVWRTASPNDSKRSLAS